jgi:hypothetical protein
MATGNPFTTGQASPAMNFIAPDIATQQQQLARQQQMADLLRSQAFAPSGDTQVIGGWAVKKSPLEGAAKLAQALGSSYMQNGIDQKNLDLAKLLQGRMSDILGGGSPQPQGNQGGSFNPLPGQLGSGMVDAADPSIAPPDQTGGDPVISRGGAPLVPAVAPVEKSSPSPANNYALANLLKGSVIGQIGGDAAAKSYWDQFGATEATKQAMAAGLDPRQANADALIKSNYIAPVNARPGSILRDPRTNMPIAYNPHVPDGATPTFDASGNVIGMKQIEGALPLIQANSRALAAGKAEVTPQAGFDASGKPVFTNQLAASQGGGTGVAPTVNTGRFGGYNAPGAGAIAPGLPPGVATAAEGQASQNTKRSGMLVDTAAESPTRVNVLDNILQLSKDGVATGPTQEWKNKAKGMAADSLGIQSWKDDVTGFQEMKKFLNQNGIRAWQAAGGTGTDSQLAAAMTANPNDKMFPGAIRTMANWAKAGELALQSKASAQDAWLARNNNNPQAQNQFEAAWRKNYDPRIYQMKLMDPTELQAFTAKLPANDRAALLQKYSTAKQNGWLQ